MKPLLDWYFPKTPALRLAVFRVLVGLYAVIYLLVRAPANVRVAYNSVSRFEPVGPVTLLEAPLPMWAVAGGWALAVVFGVCFTLGVRFRITGPLFAVFLLWVTAYRHSWGMIFHTDNLTIVHVGVLALAPSAAAWSFDARGRPEPPDEGRFGWALRLCCVVTVIAYFIAGTAKLRISGFVWGDGEILRAQIAYDNLRKIELGDIYSPFGAWLVGVPWIFAPLAIMTLVMEVAAPLALVGKRVAAVWCLLMWSFHAGVVVFMMIVFPYPLIGVAFASFFDLERGVRHPRVQRLLGRLGPAVT